MATLGQIQATQTKIYLPQGNGGAQKIAQAATEALRRISDIRTPISPLPPQSTQPQCNLCGDSGWRRVRETEPEFVFGYEINVPCEHCVTLRIDKQRAELQTVSALTDDEKRLRLSGIVVNGRADTFEMVKACSEMIEKRAFMLTIWGTNGNAKSAALIAAVNEFLDMGIPAIYLPSYDMLNWIQDAFNQDGDIKSESAYARLERLKSVRMLAVDEFQASKITDWRLEQLRNIVDRRWRDGLDGKAFTLFAMNENPHLLEPRIYSRLRDGRNRTSGEPIIVNNDSDMRPLLRRKA